MDTLRQDLLYALRRLWQSPGFSLVAIGTLALGIGANSAIFSVVNAVLLAPLPFEEPDRLMAAMQVWKGSPIVWYSPQNFLDFAAQARSFESLAAIDQGGVTLGGPGSPARVDGALVSAGFFDLLRVRPRLGRGFVEGENEPGRHHVVVLGDRLWRDRFGGDPGIVGRVVQIDREPHTVVGVAPAGFAYPERAELWLPLQYDAQFRTKSRGAWFLSVIGRLAPGATVESARQEASAIAAGLAREYPDQNEGLGGTVQPLLQVLVGDTRRALLVLLGAVGFVLLIACVNVANLLLARVSARESELALRTALGASRFRLLRQLMTESVVLAALGGAVGLLLASATLGSLLALQPEGVPRLAEVRIDRTVVTFAALLSLATGLLFGAFPALQVTARPAAPALREGGRGLLGGRSHRLRAGLVAGQMALALVLLAGAGLLLRSFQKLRQVDPGFRPESVLTFRLGFPESAYPEEPQRAAFLAELLSRLQALPGVREAGAVMGVPLGGLHFTLSFNVEGRPKPPPAQQPTMEVRVATPDYFRAMGIPVVRGRAFELGDGLGAPQVVVLSEAAVARFFPGEDPMGRRIDIGWGRDKGLPKAGGVVVGIVGNVKERGLDKEHPPEIYLPHAQLAAQGMDVVLRTAVEPASLAPAVRKLVAELDPDLPVARLQTLDAVVARSISEPRFYMLLLGAFAAAAMVLAALGVFGVMSYAVLQRGREIGIRIALGATPGEVRGMVLRQVLRLALAGVGLGLLGAVALSRAMAGLLFELSATDPVTLLAVATLLTAVAALAGYLPARRATRVDPLVALRAE